MSIQEYKSEYTYLGIAMAGVYARAPNPFSKDYPATITIYDNRLTPYYGDLAEGGVVVDKRPCIDHVDFIHLVISGPMLNDTLPDKTMKSFEHGIQHCTDAKKCSSVDYVSLDLYLNLWRELGAKVGYRHGNFIEWENGEKTEIPPVDSRFKVQKDQDFSGH